jgi:acetyl esterase/lipase
VINPGGGFSYVGSVHEGFPHAIALSQQGYNAFVLQYRVGGEQIACEDLAAALSYIFENAETLDVGTENYSVWGSSAGARMAARIGSYGAAAYGGDEIPRPATVVMAYTGHTDFTQSDPPTFAVVGDSDGIASPSTMERRVNSMRSAGIDVELHVYPNVGHGFGLGIGTSAEGWLEDAIRFWENHMSASS